MSCPNPGELLELHVDDAENVICGKSDLDNFYHRIKVPDWLMDYFGLTSGDAGRIKEVASCEGATNGLVALGVCGDR